MQGKSTKTVHYIFFMKSAPITMVSKRFSVATIRRGAGIKSEINHIDGIGDINAA